MTRSSLKGWKAIAAVVEEATGLEFTIESVRAYAKASRSNRLPLVGRFGRLPVADREQLITWARGRFLSVAAPDSPAMPG